MSKSVLIIGESGTGKSTSIRTLNPKSTFIINVMDKSLPMRGSASHYKPIKNWEDKEGNYYARADWNQVLNAILMVNKRPEVNCLVIDDFGYVMTTEFVGRALEKGYDKFTEMAAHVFEIFKTVNSLRDDLIIFIIAHSDADHNGFMKLKTIGKMLDEKVKIAGIPSAIFHSLFIDGKYKFLTQITESHLARSGMGLFEDKLIDNDLEFARKTMMDYYKGEEIC